MNYTQMLKSNDLKVTPQRVAIVEELYNFGHLNIDQLYTKLSEKFPSISLATIYKNINTMIEKVFVLEVKIPNEKSVYELIKDSHAHFVCENCKKIEDVHFDAKNLLSEVKKETSYKINSTTLVFNGLCTNCA